ncbi:hypothetical protein VTH06DRAFT_3711 [Thermothelomyces fergusii]
MLSMKAVDRMGAMPCSLPKKACETRQDGFPQKKAAVQGPLCGQAVLAPRICGGSGYLGGGAARAWWQARPHQIYLSVQVEARTRSTFLEAPVGGRHDRRGGASEACAHEPDLPVVLHRDNYIVHLLRVRTLAL